MRIDWATSWPRSSGVSLIAASSTRPSSGDTATGALACDDDSVLTVGEEAHRQAELAVAEVAVGRFNAAVAHLSAAIRGFTAAVDNRNAAIALRPPR